MFLSRISRVSARVVKGRPRFFPTDPSKKALILTPEAVKRLKELLLENPGAEAMKVSFILYIYFSIFIGNHIFS